MLEFTVTLIEAMSRSPSKALSKSRIRMWWEAFVLETSGALRTGGKLREFVMWQRQEPSFRQEMVGNKR